MIAGNLRPNIILIIILLFFFQPSKAEDNQQDINIIELPATFEEEKEDTDNFDISLENENLETKPDKKDGKDTYAKTKGLGEVINDKHLTLRTSVVGPELKSDGEELFNWFMSQSVSINGFNKAIWSGVTSIELAKAVKWSIENEITGLYHLTNNQPINKNEILQLFKKYTKKDIDILPVDGECIDKSFIDTRELIDYDIPSYNQMISEMVESIINHRSFYPQYKFGNICE